MLEESVLKNKELVITLAAGIALVLFVTIGYLDIWKPRNLSYNKDENDENTPVIVKLKSIIRTMPWTIKLTIAGSLIYAIIYTVYRIMVPPNW